jgi:hypothetical protein
MNKFAISALIPKLQDEVLKQIAQKRNPLESPLALVELNRRQQMRLESAAPDAPSHGPTVFDSQMSRLAGTGLGRIAPNNVAVMAKGGLAALAEDDDDVPRYNGSQEQLVREWNALPPVQRGAASSLGELFGNLFSRDDQRIDPETREPISFAEFLRRKEARQLTAPTAGAAGGYDDTQRLAKHAATAAGERTTGAPAPAPAGGRRPAGPALAPAAAPAAPAAAPVAAAPTDYGAQFASVLGKLPDPFEADRNAQLGREADVAQRTLRAREAVSARAEELFGERGRRLQEDERNLSKQRNQNVAMSLIQAGAAIATTPGPAMAAIARGMGVGAKQYESGLVELNKSQQLLRASRERLEDARLGNEREKAMAGVEAERMIAEAHARRLAGIQAVYNVNVQTARTILSEGAQDVRHQKDITSREQIAREGHKVQREGHSAQLKAAGMGAAPRDAVSLLANSMNIPYHQAFQYMQTVQGKQAALKYLSDDWEKNAQQIRMKFPNIQSFADYAAAQGMPLAGGAAGSSLQFEGKLPK